MRYLQKRESSLRRELKTCEEAVQDLLKSFLSFEWGLKDCNEEKCHGNRKKSFYSMLYIASAKS